MTSNVLKSFYKAKEAIDYVRFPGSYKSEGNTRKRNKNESAKETETLDLAYVTIERLEKSKDIFIKLKSLKFEFMAEIGITESKPFIELEQI